MKISERVRGWWRNKSKDVRGAAATLVVGFALACAAYVLTPGAPGPAEDAVRAVNYSDFMAMAKAKRLKSASLGRRSIEATAADGEKIVLKHDGWLDVAALPRELNELGVEVGFDAPKAAQETLRTASLLLSLLPTLLLGAVLITALLQMRGAGSLRWPEVVKDARVRFADVAGHAEPKVEIEELKSFIANRADYERVGAKSPKGVLLVGPPGTGKTLLAKALAGESGASFIAVSGSDFSSMFVGVGRSRVRKLFKTARRKKPCIVFIDEIDGMGKKRGGSSSDVSRDGDSTLNQLLVEMDGFAPLDGVTVVAATNRIDVLDPALLRPGRFDRQIHIGLPTLADRRELLRVHVRERPLADDVDLERIARGTSGFSGADIANLANEAAVLAARRARSLILGEDFEEARDKVIMGLKRQSLVMDEDERKLVAYHEGGHALAACKLKESDPVHQATIVPRGRALGLVMRLPLKDKVIVRRSKLEADLTVLMAGRAAEELVFGAEHVSNGAASDIEEATKIARSMVMQWGMGTKGGLVRFEEETPEVRADIRRILERHYSDAKRLVAGDRDALDRVADALLERETLEGDVLRGIVAGDEAEPAKKPERATPDELEALAEPA